MGKPKAESSLSIPRYKWEDNIQIVFNLQLSCILYYQVGIPLPSNNSFYIFSQQIYLLNSLREAAQSLLFSIK